MNRFLRGAALAGLFLAAAFSLPACQSTDAAIGAAGDSAKFARICDAEPAVHVAFVLLAPSVGLSAKAIAQESTAHAIVRDVCARPPANLAEALSIAAAAYADVLAINARAAEREST